MNCTLAPALSQDDSGYNRSIIFSGHVTSLTNITFGTYGETSESSKLIQNIESILNKRVILATCIFGIIGNLLSLLVLTKKCITSTMERMEKCAHIGLLALAVSDFLFCVSTIPHSFIDVNQFGYKSVNFWLLYRMYGNGIINTFIMSSTWLTVAMAIARYLAIGYPILGRQIIGIKSCLLTVSIVFLFCLIFNLPRFIFQKGDYVDCLEGWRSYYAIDGLWLTYPRLGEAYIWFYFVLCIFIPFCVLAYCNVYLIHALRMSARMRRQHSRSRDMSADSKNILTLTLAIIVIFYLCLVTPAEMLNFAKNYVILSPSLATSDRYNLAVAICNALQAINCAFNFVLYCVINAPFRRTVKMMCGFKIQEREIHLQTWSTQQNGRMRSIALYPDRLVSNSCTTRL